VRTGAGVQASKSAGWGTETTVGEASHGAGAGGSAGVEQFETSEHDGISIVSVRGELDTASEEKFREAVTRAIDERLGPVVVDLTRCSFIDSVSIGILAGAQRSLETEAKPGAALAVVAGRFPARALKLAAVDLYIPVFATLDEAVKAVRERSADD
jgi:anti-sigma B factor antagonist